MQYTDEYFGRCNDEFNYLMKLKDRILFYRRNNRLFDLYGIHKQDPVNANGHSYYAKGDKFTEEFNKKDDEFAGIIEDYTPVLNSETSKNNVLSYFRKNLILYTTLVDSKSFRRDILDRIDRNQDLLEIIDIVKKELYSIYQGYMELLEVWEEPVYPNIVTDNRVFVENATNVHKVNINDYPEAISLNDYFQHIVQPTRRLQKGIEIFTVPAKNVHPVNLLLETRKRNPNTRAKKKSRYFSLETRKRDSKTREKKKAAYFRVETRKRNPKTREAKKARYFSLETRTRDSKTRQAKERSRVQNKRTLIQRRRDENEARRRETATGLRI